MSTCYSAKMLLGVRIPCNKIDKLLEATVEKTARRMEFRGCKHDVPETFKFCHECGKQRIITQVIKDPVPEAYSFFSKLKVYASCSYEQDWYITLNENWRRIVDISDGDSDASMEFYQLLDFQAMGKELKEILEPFGMWNEQEFKIWLIGEIS